MKQKTEERAEAALKTLVKSLGRDLEDIRTILDEFEATHTEHECDQSKTYGALVACLFAFTGILEEINNH